MTPLGLLNIDKPQGITSHDVVSVIRRGTGIKKIGHAGTLDPMATGVLIICVGNATRLSQYVMDHDKVYHATLRLGIETDTYDAEGTVVQTTEGTISENELKAILAQFRGDIQQIPPMYSAIKKGGKKLYELAREGKTIEREPRPVTIHELDIMRWDFPEVDLHVKCTAGTYIRSLAHDIGQETGLGGHLTALRRVSSGEFHMEDAVKLDTLKSAFADGTWENYLQPGEIAVRNMHRLDLSTEQVKIVQNGGFIPRQTDEVALASAFNERGDLIAIMESHDSFQWKPRQVLQRD
ncbi:MAG: tRNA pseudouridine(55) synthase TruB [Chloroflexi bacterium]|nr:tRNA pseudouridine(55) synthase TruB [Chloroflexota bacterium]